MTPALEIQLKLWPTITDLIELRFGRRDWYTAKQPRRVRLADRLYLSTKTYNALRAEFAM